MKIITRRHFKTNKMYKRWEAVAIKYGYSSVNDFIYTEYINGYKSMNQMGRMASCSHNTIAQILIAARIITEKSHSFRGEVTQEEGDAPTKYLCTKCGVETTNRMLCGPCFRKAPSEPGYAVHMPSITAWG